VAIKGLGWEGKIGKDRGERAKMGKNNSQMNMW